MIEKDKDPKKLTAEELEKRVAPLALTYSDPTQDPPPPPPDRTVVPDPGDPPTGGGGSGTGAGRGGRVQQ